MRSRQTQNFRFTKENDIHYEEYISCYLTHSRSLTHSVSLTHWVTLTRSHPLRPMVARSKDRLRAPLHPGDPLAILLSSCS